MAGTQSGNSTIRDTNPKISKSPSLRKFFSTPRDQGAIGWCYGFSASDLLSAHLGADVSSFHVSSLYNRSARKNPLRWLLQESISAVRNADPENKLKHVYVGGFAKNALEEAMKNAYVCSEKDLPFDPDKMLQLIGEFEKIRSERKAARDPKYKELICSDVQDVLEANNLAINASDITEQLLSKDINSVLYKIGNKQCITNPVMVPYLQIKDVPTPYKKKGKEYVLNKKTNGKEFLSNISNLLGKGKPVEVAYDAIEYTEVAGGHSSVVTARRWYNGKCQFKIRNSWGKSCALYKSTVDCEEETGSFWVNDEHFAKATLSTTYIE